MKLTTTRETILTPIQKVMGAVQQKSPMPALENVYIDVDEDGYTTFTATDLELSLSATGYVDHPEPGTTTANAKKLHDIVKSLPQGASITLAIDKGRLTVKSGKSRFTLSTLPAEDFPSIKSIDPSISFEMGAAELKEALDLSAFAMAVEDVRYYLNGLCLDFGGYGFTCAATNGHRLSTCSVELDQGVEGHRYIIPRKGVQEIAKLLKDGSGTVAVDISTSHIRIQYGDSTLTSKLIDGKYPDYTKVVPTDNDKEVRVEPNVLRQAINRASIMASEKTKGVRVDLSSGSLTVSADNNDATEEVEVEYSGDDLSVGFHAPYLIDVLERMQGNECVIEFGGEGSAVLIHDPEEGMAQHVVMPMRL